MGRQSGLGVAVLVLAIAGCGGGDDEGGGEERGGGETETAQQSTLAMYDWEAQLVSPSGFSTESAAAARQEAVGKDAIVVRDATQPGGTRFFVLHDVPALTTADIVTPKALTDPATGEPAIGFELTPAGREKFQALTRAVARSGNHFAIVVDGELLSLPAIDAKANPNGIDGRSGVFITGGLTTAEAEELAQGLAGSSGSGGG